MKYPIIYIYKRTSDKGRELRYSLRSLANLKNWDGRYFIVGDKEDWMESVIPADKFAQRHEDVQAKFRAIVKSKIIPNDFILFNDDFYVTRPVELKHLHQGELEGAGLGDWHKAKGRTRAYLIEQGVKSPKDYDIHVPMIMNKQKLAEVLEINKGRNERNFLMTRSLYGNIHKVGGTFYQDQKARTNKLPDAPFISTTMYTDALKSIGVPEKKLPIPKIIHQVWVGPLPPPTKWMDTWEEKNPDWEYILWDNEKVFSRKWKNQLLIDEYVKRAGEVAVKGTFTSNRGATFRGEKATLFAWHVIADLLRYEILYEYGGYMPGADTVCLKNITPKFNTDFGIYTVRTGNLYTEKYAQIKETTKGRRKTKAEQLSLGRYAYENASPILASKKRHPFLKACIDELHKLKPSQLSEAVDTTGNVFMGKMIRKLKPKDLRMIDYVVNANKIKADQYSIHYAGTTHSRYKEGRYA